MFKCVHQYANGNNKECIIKTHYPITNRTNEPKHIHLKLTLENRRRHKHMCAMLNVITRSYKGSGAL